LSCQPGCGAGAKAWSQLRARHDAEAALHREDVGLAKLPQSSTPEHHFVFDPSKLIFFAGTCYVWLGEDARAEGHARQVITESRATGKLTRVAEAHIDLGLVALRRGDVDEAIALAAEAFRGSRLCATTWGRIAEFDRALSATAADVLQVHEFRERYGLTARRLSL
jgi:hypothetical protein